jgi:hypothetical protein
MEFTPVVYIIKVTSCGCNFKVFVLLSVDGQLQEVILFKHVYLDYLIGTDEFTVWRAHFPDLLLLVLFICKTKFSLVKSTDLKELKFYIH